MRKYAIFSLAIILLLFTVVSSEPGERDAESGVKRGDEKQNLVLTKLIVLNRHGHRAPNAPYWSMCPNDRKNRRKYNVGAEDLTARGMKEEYELGEYLRNAYRDFIGPRFNRSRHFLRAVGEPRILQSAQAVAQGLFPDGYGPGGYLPRQPQFVPVFSDMDTHEYLLDDVPCFRRAERDMRRWLNTSLSDFIADPKVSEVLNYMKRMCGVSEKDMPPVYAFLKTVADGMTFNADFGLSVCHGKVTPEMLFKIRKVSLRLLMARLYHTDEQQTYTSVDLPYRILYMLNRSTSPGAKGVNDYSDTEQEAILYFMHREALYAVGEFFGFTFNVPGLPHGELPVASTIVWERLVPEKSVGEEIVPSRTYVRLILWTPKDGTATVAIPHCRTPQLCTLKELQDIYSARVKRTGSWLKLCNFTITELDHDTDIR